MVDSVLGCIDDIQQSLAKSMYEKDADAKAAMRAELASTTLPRFFGMLEKYITAGEWAAGNALSVADLELYVICNWIKSGMRSLQFFTLIFSSLSTFSSC